MFEQQPCDYNVIKTPLFQPTIFFAYINTASVVIDHIQRLLPTFGIYTIIFRLIMHMFKYAILLTKIRDHTLLFEHVMQSHLP